MKKLYSITLFVLMIVSAITAAISDPKIVFLGEFSNYRFTEDHQYGAEVKIWKDATSVFGSFSYANGQVGDTPTGLLKKISYEPATGRIAFSAKLTTGQHFCKLHRDVPSRDLFRFEGTLAKSSLSGKLKQTDTLHPELDTKEENVVLEKSIEIDAPGFRNKQEWESSMKDILRVRGPKW